MGTLNCKGIRERALKKELGHYYGKICLELQKKLKDDRAKVDEADVRRSARIRATPKVDLEFKDKQLMELQELYINQQQSTDILKDNLERVQTFLQAGDYRSKRSLIVWLNVILNG